MKSKNKIKIRILTSWFRDQIRDDNNRDIITPVVTYEKLRFIAFVRNIPWEQRNDFSGGYGRVLPNGTIASFGRMNGNFQPGGTNGSSPEEKRIFMCCSSSSLHHNYCSIRTSWQYRYQYVNLIPTIIVTCSSTLKGLDGRHRLAPGKGRLEASDRRAPSTTRVGEFEASPCQG